MNLEFLGIKVILDGESGHVEFPDPARPRVPLLLSSAKRPPLPVGEGRVRAFQLAGEPRLPAKPSGRRVPFIADFVGLFCRFADFVGLFTLRPLCATAL